MGEHGLQGCGRETLTLRGLGNGPVFTQSLTLTHRPPWLILSIALSPQRLPENRDAFLSTKFQPEICTDVASALVMQPNYPSPLSGCLVPSCPAFRSGSQFHFA